MQRGDAAEWQYQYSNPSGTLKTLEGTAYRISVVTQLAGAKAPSPSLAIRGPEGPRFHLVCWRHMAVGYRLPRLTCAGKSACATLAYLQVKRDNRATWRRRCRM